MGAAPSWGPVREGETGAGRGRAAWGRRGGAPAPAARHRALLSLSLCPATGAVCPGPSDFSLCAATCWGGSPRVLEWFLSEHDAGRSVLSSTVRTDQGEGGGQACDVLLESAGIRAGAEEGPGRLVGRSVSRRRAGWTLEPRLAGRG